MSARMGAGAPEADWVAADALVVAFAVLVTLILDVVPGWSAPLRAWLAIATWLFGALSVHAVVQGVIAARDGRWRRAGVAAALGAGLAAAAAVMLLLAVRLPRGDDARIFDDAPAVEERR